MLLFTDPLLGPIPGLSTLSLTGENTLPVDDDGGGGREGAYCSTAL